MLARKKKTAKNLEPIVKGTTTPRLNTEKESFKANDQKRDESKD